MNKNETMKKYIKIIIINILILITLFCIIEFLCYKEVCRRFQWTADTSYLKLWNETGFHNYHSYFKKNLALFTDEPKIFSKNSKSKGSIIITGCSMAYGNGLDDTQTVSYKLSEILNKTVYNMAIRGGGVNQILYMLDNSIIKNYVKEEPKYFIYFYNPDHLRRIFVRLRDPYIIYKKNGNKLELKNNIFIENFWAYNLLHDEIRFGTISVLNRYAEDYFLLYLSEIEAKIKALYPNTKFVIVKFSYDELNTDISKIYDVIDIPKLTNIDVMLNEEENIKKYSVDNNFHPNENYWNEVVPVLLKELRKI